MSKLQNRVMSMNFKKAGVRFIIIALTVILLGGVAVGVTFRTQISEIITYSQKEDQNELTNEQQEQLTEDNEKYNQKENQEENQEEDGEHYGKSENNDHEFFDSAQFTKPSTGMKIALCSYIGICGLFALAYWLIIAAWLFQASVKAGMSSLLWTALGLFFNVLAVIAFLIVRNFMNVCPNCGTYQKSAKYCRSCGAEMQIKCAGCGTVVKPMDLYCSHCGKELNSNQKNKE
ncbi:MAG: zinc ribbon domain-containing protein [Oscillospiraceae bacterium]|nr:zinc ribbon domain-containing protein [Oscillospiraceae bacterium]